MKPKTVLIIDDDPDYVVAVSALLTSAGYEVHSAPDGTAGLREARALVPDLVLLDVMMTERTEGLTTLQQIRAVPELATTRVAVISSLYAELPILQVSPDAGGVAADLCLPKPVDPARLLAEAARLTQR